MSRVFQGLQKCQAEADAETPPKTPQVQVIIPGKAAESRPGAEDDMESENVGAVLPFAVRTLPFCAPDNGRRIAFPASSSEAAEQYRILRTRILQHPKKPQFVLISSASAGDGKTTTAVNLAWALAVAGEGRVLLLETDLRRSSLHFQLGVPRSPGLAEIAARECQLSDALIRLEQFPNLYVLLAGSVSINAAELLNSRRWTELCATIRKHFKFVIADSPPIGAAADYELIQAVCDAVLLVARPDHTRRTLLLDVLGMTGQSKLLGILLNSVPKWFMWKYQYHDFYKP
jgi:capsular exopolysaccharide synthesis family protein